MSLVAIVAVLRDDCLCFESQHGVSVPKQTWKKVPPRMAADRYLVLTALALAALSIAVPAAAQTVAKPAVAEKAADNKAGEAAKAFASGTKAFEAGKTDAAVTALSVAITMGGLKNPDLAKAMFYRGVAYRKQKMPAAALSDLNAAVWLREGLSATDKAVAEDHRQALLREVAGLNGPSGAKPVETASTPVPSAADIPAPLATTPVVSQDVAEPQAQPMPWAMAEVAPSAAPEVAAETPQLVEAAAVPQPRAEAAPAPAGPDGNRAANVEVASAPPQDADTISEPVATVAPVERAVIATVQAEAAPPEKPLPWQMASSDARGPSPRPAEQSALPWGASAPEPAGAIASVASEPTSAPATAVQTAFAPDTSHSVKVPSAVANAPAALADASNAAGAFLGNLFGGGSAETEPAPTVPPADTSVPLAASVIETAALPEQSKTVAPAPVVWPAETKAAPIADSEPVAPVTQPTVRVAAAETVPPAAAPPPAAVLPGPYRLQIAAENSRADAEQTLSRLVSAHGPSLRGLEPVVEEPATGGVLFGSMGAAYRVSVGPYASSMEPGRLCNILKAHGFDCRVVAIAP